MKKLTEYKLSEAQKRKWIETRSALLWKCPAFTHILFSMLNPSKGELAAVFTTDVPIAATDGSNLILNPEKFFEFMLKAFAPWITRHKNKGQDRWAEFKRFGLNDGARNIRTTVSDAVNGTVGFTFKLVPWQLWVVLGVYLAFITAPYWLPGFRKIASGKGK